MKPNNYNVGEAHLLWMHDELLSLLWEHNWSRQNVYSSCLVAPSANVKSEMTWPGWLEGWWGSRITGLQRCSLPYTAQLCQSLASKILCNTTWGNWTKVYRGWQFRWWLCVRALHIRIRGPLIAQENYHDASVIMLVKSWAVGTLSNDVWVTTFSGVGVFTCIL